MEIMDSNFENPAVQHFISYLEGIINRMAANSANCKNWLLAIIAGCMAMQPSMQGVVDKIWLAYPLIALFCILDSYYLGCEKYYRDMVNDFVKEVRKDGEQYVPFLYKFTDRSVYHDVDAVLSGLTSIATWPFYGTILAIVLLISNKVIDCNCSVNPVIAV